MAALNSVIVSDVSNNISKLKEATHQYQPLINQQANGQSSLDYLYQAISLIETKNNTPNPFFNNNNASNTNSQGLQSSNNPINLMNNLNQQLLLNNHQQNVDIQNKQHQMFTAPFILPASKTPTTADAINQQHQRLYGPINNQPQFSVVDCRRYFNNLMFQQQMQKNQQQMTCIDPYCNCGINQSVTSINNRSAKLASINNNFIGQHQDQQPRQSLETKQLLNKTIKQRRKEERNERRSTNNLVQASSKILQSELTQTSLQNKKNISKLLQKSKETDLDIQIISESSKSYLNTKKAIPSRLEKAKQLARKQQNNLKLNLSQTNLQMIEKHEGLLTPLSATSMFSPNTTLNSPGSATSLSPISPHLTSNSKNLTDLGSLQQHSRAPVFNYYPVEMLNNVMPLYMTPYLNNLTNNGPVEPSPQLTQTTGKTPNIYQFPTSNPVNTTNSTNNIDQLYFQNLVTAIYTIANYQQQQQHQQHQQHLQQQQQLQQQQTNFTNVNQPGLVTGISELLNMNKYIAIKPNLTNNLNFKSNNTNTNNNSSNEVPKTFHKEKIKPVSLTPIRKIQSPVKTFSKRKSAFKLISYIGNDIEAKVNEHFRRSLGSKYTKLVGKLSTPPSSTDIGLESNKLIINESEDVGISEALINDTDNNLKEDWSDLNNINNEEFCDYSYVQNSPQSQDYSCAKSDDQCADVYDLDYQSDENLIEDYGNEEEADIVEDSDPLSPVSTGSYSYSIINHTPNIINNEEDEQLLNEPDYQNVSSEKAVVEDIKNLGILPIIST